MKKNNKEIDQCSPRNKYVRNFNAFLDKPLDIVNYYLSNKIFRIEQKNIVY